MGRGRAPSARNPPPSGLSRDGRPFPRHRRDSIAPRVFAEMVARFDATGDGERAILALERMISIDPGEESRHRRLLGLEARYHGPDAPLARDKSLAALLKRALDTEPEAAT